MAGVIVSSFVFCRNRFCEIKLSSKLKSACCVRFLPKRRRSVIHSPRGPVPSPRPRRFFARVRAQAVVPCLEEVRTSGKSGHTHVEGNGVSFSNARQGIERLGLQVRSFSLSVILNISISPAIVLCCNNPLMLSSLTRKPA